MKIVAPYFVTDESVHEYDTHDKVEREGYVPNDKKIDSFINTGMLMQNMRIGGEDYEIQGGESDFEADSIEFRNELTQDAENFAEQPLSQFLDKITAEEILADSENALKEREKTSKEKKLSRKKSDAEKIISSLDKGFGKLIDKLADAPKAE